MPEPAHYLEPQALEATRTSSLQMSLPVLRAHQRLANHGCDRVREFHRDAVVDIEEATNPIWRCVGGDDHRLGLGLSLRPSGIKQAYSHDVGFIQFTEDVVIVIRLLIITGVFRPTLMPTCCQPVPSLKAMHSLSAICSYKRLVFFISCGCRDTWASNHRQTSVVHPMQQSSWQKQLTIDNRRIPLVI